MFTPFTHLSLQVTQQAKQTGINYLLPSQRISENSIRNFEKSQRCEHFSLHGLKIRDNSVRRERERERERESGGVHRLFFDVGKRKKFPVLQKNIGNLFQSNGCLLPLEFVLQHLNSTIELFNSSHEIVHMFLIGKCIRLH